MHCGAASGTKQWGWSKQWAGPSRALATSGDPVWSSLSLPSTHTNTRSLPVSTRHFVPVIVSAKRRVCVRCRNIRYKERAGRYTLMSTTQIDDANYCAFPSSFFKVNLSNYSWLYCDMIYMVMIWLCGNMLMTTWLLSWGCFVYRMTQTMVSHSRSEWCFLKQEPI